ncbi:serine/threonine-protein kinase [Actinopolymorpha sp. B9G3]|uniref:serine/threonine-protein kinase n=1 Tax=Actinopolymorpha sp. B9G3 TaxID=3158970 RepID=UPI0032D9403A
MLAGRYELVDILGEGGMGAVWRTWDHREHRYVAAKVLQQFNAGSLLRFVREQSFRISHPHVITPLGWAGEDERVLFTMQMVHGGSVASLQRNAGRLPPQWAALLLDQLLDGLGAVHAAGLVHRDVKPANLLLEATGRARPHVFLSDFGVAVPLDEPRMTRTSQVFGTPGYLAPEQVRGAEPEPRHDLYSAGVVAVEMLTGVRPDPDVGVGTHRPDHVPPPLWDYLRRLAAWSAGGRPDSAAHARSELAATGLLPDPGAVPSDPAGVVDIADVIPPLPPGWVPNGPSAADFVRRSAPHPPSVKPALTEPTTPRDPRPARPPAPSGRHWRQTLVGLTVVAALGMSAYVAQAALRGEQPPDPGTHTPGTQAPETSSSSPSPSPSPSASGERSPGTSPPTGGSGSDARPGEPCTYIEVGLIETTRNGERVTCVRRENAYSWERTS